MRQNNDKQKLVTQVLQTINLAKIADNSLSQTVEILLNLIEQLQTQLKELQEENQRLRDEKNSLKGEQQPKIKAKKPIRKPLEKVTSADVIAFANVQSVDSHNGESDQQKRLETINSLLKFGQQIGILPTTQKQPTTQKKHCL